MARKREAETQPTQAPSQQPELSARPKPLVFISHDTRDAEIAEAFSNLLTDASGGVLHSFRSSDRKGTSGIEFGTEWYSAIMERLDRATDVVALLTEHSIDRPWLLYEAGVAKGKLDRTVFGLAIGVPLNQASVGPFAQFQNSADDEDSLTKLVLQLIRRNPDASPREEAVRRQVVAFRETTRGILDARKLGSVVAPADENGEGSVAKLFEEVKAMVGQLPERLEGAVASHVRRSSGLRRRRLHPSLVEEVLYGVRDLDPREQMTAFLIAASIIRDDLPWLYDILSELHRAVLRGDRRASETIFRSLMRLYESRFVRYGLGESTDRESAHVSHLIFRRLQEVMEGILVRIPTRLSSTRRTDGQMVLPTDPATPAASS